MTAKAILVSCLLFPALAAAGRAQGYGSETGGEGEGIVVFSDASLDSLTIGGQLRVRAETWDPRPPVKGAGSSGPSQIRGRIHLDARVNENIMGFVELQESVITYGSASTDTLHQAYGVFMGIADTADVQGGRFEMLYGNQRMVSPLDWSVTGRAWDGARVIVMPGDTFRLDFFGTSPVVGQGGSPGESFYGFYGEWLPELEFSADGYVLKRRNPNRLLDDYTIGALVEGDHDLVTWSAEAAFQVGEHGPSNAELDATGFAVALRGDVDVGGGVLLGAGVEYASGDGDPNDGDDGTFRRLFNFDHSYQGYADIVVWQNLIDFVLRSSVPVAEDWRVTGDVHFLRLADKTDALYTGIGAPGAVASGTSRNIGTEIDLALKGQVSDSLGIWTGVSYTFIGSGVANGNDQIWAFVQGVLEF